MNRFHIFSKRGFWCEYIIHFIYITEIKQSRKISFSKRDLRHRGKFKQPHLYSELNCVPKKRSLGPKPGAREWDLIRKERHCSWQSSYDEASLHQAGPQPSDWCPYKKRETWTRGDHHGTMGQRLERCTHRSGDAQGCGRLCKLGRRRDLASWLQRQQGPAHTLTSDSWPPEL